MVRRLSCLLIIMVLSLPVYCQDNNKLQDNFLEAEYFFMKEDYADAVVEYLKLYEKLPDNQNLAYRIGACYNNISGKKNLSIAYLEAASKNMSARQKEGSLSQVAAPFETLFELGKAYRINYMFIKAKDAFNKYLATLLPEDKENIEFVRHEIAVCDMAAGLISKPVSFTEENIGGLFNDEKDNFNPVISADGKSFVYMVKLKFYNAVMFSKFENGKWEPPVNITPELQPEGDLYISGLSADGKILLFSMDDNVSSDIYTSSYDGSNWTKAVKLNSNINTKNWESHGFMSESGDQLIFSSDRPGGFGGLDLYISRKVDGEWGPAVNLGPEINTPFNEDRPFLINNGRSLFFSSQGHENLGGYDIFRSDLKSDSKWSPPENLGYPLNTPDDNIFFMPVSDGKSGYNSVFNESDGFGNLDIFKVAFK